MFYEFIKYEYISSIVHKGYFHGHDMPSIAAPPPCCLRCSANAATALPTLPPCCCRPHSSAALWLLPSHPAALLLATAKLPPPLSPPPMLCHRRPCTTNTSAMLPTITSPLLRCLCCSADAATALPPLSPCCRYRHCTEPLHDFVLGDKP